MVNIKTIYIFLLLFIYFLSVTENNFASGKQLKELLSAAEVGNINRMKNLIDATKQFGCTNQWMTSEDKKGRSPLQISSMHGYTNVVELIVKEIIESIEDDELRNKYINSQDYKGRSALFYAVADDRLSTVKLLVENGADVEAITNGKHAQPGSTVLMACAEKNNFECFEFLIANGANISITREDGADATYIAARYGHNEIIGQIVEMKDSNLLVNRSTFRGRTALITSAFHGHFSTCKILLGVVENIDHQDEDGITALMYAAKGGYLQLVKLLVQNRANINIENKDQENALSYAVKYEHKEVAKFLRKCNFATSATNQMDTIKPIIETIKGRKGSVPNLQRKGKRRMSLYPGVKLC